MIYADINATISREGGSVTDEEHIALIDALVDKAEELGLLAGIVSQLVDDEGGGDQTDGLGE